MSGQPEIGINLLTEQHRQKISQSLKATYQANPKSAQSEATKAKISASMKGNRNATHRGDRQSFYKGQRMDSSWEVGVARYLDEQEVEWKYGQEKFLLSDGRYYFPDFGIYNQGTLVKLIEVKGHFREENRKKFEAFLLEYPNLEVELWRKNDLHSKGIITVDGYLKG